MCHIRDGASFGCVPFGKLSSNVFIRTPHFWASSFVFSVSRTTSSEMFSSIASMWFVVDCLIWTEKPEGVVWFFIGLSLFCGQSRLKLFLNEFFSDSTPKNIEQISRVLKKASSFFTRVGSVGCILHRGSCFIGYCQNKMRWIRCRSCRNEDWRKQTKRLTFAKCGGGVLCGFRVSCAFLLCLNRALLLKHPIF